MCCNRILCVWCVVVCRMAQYGTVCYVTVCCSVLQCVATGYCVYASPWRAFWRNSVIIAHMFYCTATSYMHTYTHSCMCVRVSAWMSECLCVREIHAHILALLSLLLSFSHTRTLARKHAHTHRDQNRICVLCFYAIHTATHITTHAATHTATQRYP